MTFLLEIKQRIKGFYAQYEVYLLPVFKFVLAMVYFVWINANMGYMSALNDVFIELILSLICSILPTGMIVFAGCVLMLGHCYALGIEVAGFMLVLLLVLLILFLRFSAGKNIVLVFTPLAFAFEIPAILPIGCGLLSNAVSALPAGGGVILYYFIRLLHAQSQTLAAEDADIMTNLKLLSDGLVQNSEMWITLIAFVAVILVVNLIRTRMFDYAWRVAIVAGGVIYIIIMLLGSISFAVNVDMVSLVVFTVVAVLISIVLEFFVFGGDYSRTERLEYEDDEYYYYVKAVPKALVATSERNIKKINGKPSKEEKRQEKIVKHSGVPLFQSEGTAASRKPVKTEEESVSVIQKPDTDDIDFEKKLEESLKDL